MSPELNAMVEKLEDRCKAAGLKVEERCWEHEDGDGEMHFSYYGWYAKDPAPSGKSAHLQVQAPGISRDADEEGIRFALSTRFEHYRYLENYEGVWSKVDGVVEAEVRFPRSYGDSRGAIAAIDHQRLLLEGGERILEEVVPIPVCSATARVDFAYGSPEFLLWRTASPAINLLNPGSKIPVLRIQDPNITSRERAVELVESLGLAALLELDASLGVSGQLQKPYPMLFRGRNRLRGLPTPLSKTPPPVPALLFLSAKRQGTDPVSEFLTLYHVLEYFFPKLSYAAEASRMKRQVPSASALSEQLITDLLKSTNSKKAGDSGIGSEIEQLTTTIKHSISDQEVRGTIFHDEELKSFFSQLEMPIVTVRVGDQRDKDGKKKKCDHREQLAKRIYAIRNRIVHKKESKDPVLLPFAPEVADLYEDVRVLELLARRLIEKESVPLPSEPGTPETRAPNEE